MAAVAVLDNFESLIWTDRYCGYGDFEIYTKAAQDTLETLQRDYFLWMRESDHVMIIEDIAIKFDVENGNVLIITGRSGESLLGRRIVWAQTVLSGNLQNGIQQLLTENVIVPTIPDRAMPNFIFEATDDPTITSLTVEAQFTRTNLYDTTVKLCGTNNLGFKVTLADDSEQLVCKLYSGVDRSYDQFTNPYVIFSPQFENIMNSSYSESRKTLRTVTLVAGEGEGAARKTTIIGGGSSFARRELYTDARDLSQTVDEITMTDEAYLAQLAQRGTEDLLEHVAEKAFEAQVEASRVFKYGEDFFLGDIVQIVSEYGIKARARITEIIRTQSTTGISMYPTFIMLE